MIVTKGHEDLSWSSHQRYYIKLASDFAEDKNRILFALFVEKNMTLVYTFKEDVVLSSRNEKKTVWKIFILVPSELR